jgi:hypothetical protein
LAKEPGTWWPCERDDAEAAVEIILTSTVSTWANPKNKIEETYVVTSAVPAHDPAGFGCHSCAPLIGVAVFIWKIDRWTLENANAAVGLYGAWGEPPSVDLITIGSAKHGILLSSSWGGQGYTNGSKFLLAPVGKTVSEIWRIDDEQDNKGAYDPKGVDGPSTLYRSSAALRFDCIIGDCSNGYYDIELISRGMDRENAAGIVKWANWTNVYEFKDGMYKLVRHQSFREIKVITSQKH